VIVGEDYVVLRILGELRVAQHLVAVLQAGAVAGEREVGIADSDVDAELGVIGDEVAVDAIGADVAGVWRVEPVAVVGIGGRERAVRGTGGDGDIVAAVGQLDAAALGDVQVSVGVDAFGLIVAGRHVHVRRGPEAGVDAVGDGVGEAIAAG